MRAQPRSCHKTVRFAVHLSACYAANGLCCLSLLAAGVLGNGAHGLCQASCHGLLPDCKATAWLSVSGIQALAAAKKGRTDQLQAVEENTSRLCSARQQVETWLRDNEAKSAHLQETLKPEDVIIATDALSQQAMQAQVRFALCASCESLLAEGLQELDELVCC